MLQRMSHGTEGPPLPGVPGPRGGAGDPCAMAQPLEAVL